MIRLNILLIFLFFINVIGYSQQTPPILPPTDCSQSLPIIRTDPDNPINSERNGNTAGSDGTILSDMTNHFDWRSPIIPFWNFSEGQMQHLTNMFYYTNDPDKDYICRKANSDFQPSEGWELIRADLCYNPATLTWNNVTYYPYIILYNKYSGTLRVIAAFTDKGAQQAIRVSLTFLNQNDLGDFPNLTTSGLFSTYSSPAYTLDQETDIKTVSTLSDFPGDKRFFYADFHLAYDPCTCANESAIKVGFTSLLDSKIELAGRLTGESQPITEENDGLWEVDENNKFLTSLFTDNSSNVLNVKAGTLTYDKLSESVEDMKKAAESAKNKEWITTSLEILSMATELLAHGEDLKIGDLKNSGLSQSMIDELSDKYEAHAKGLEAAAQISDYLKEQTTPEGETAASVIIGEMSLSGTVELESSDILKVDIAVPGSKNSNMRPSIYDGAHPAPVYPNYNLPLGVFAMLKMPVIYKYQTYQSPYIPSGVENGFGYYRSTYRLAEPLEYMFNPVLNIDYDNTYIQGALVIESTPGLNYDPSSGMVDLEEVYEASATSTETTKKIYSTPFADLNELSTFTPMLEYFNLTSFPQHTVYLKLIIYVQYKDLNRYGQPIYTSYILKYPINPTTKSILDQNGHPVDFSGLQATINDPNTPNTPLNTTTIGPLEIPATTYNTVNTNGIITGQVQNINVRETITIDGNQTEGTGVTLVNIRSGKEIIQDVLTDNGETVIDGGSNGNFVLEPLNYNVAPILTTQKTVDYATSTFCLDATQYKANISGSKLAASNLQANTGKSSFFENNSLSLQIYPNPAVDGTMISYLIMQGDYINVIITDLVGNKILDLSTGYQSKGQYQLKLPIEKLQAGIYFCTVKAGDRRETKRVSIVK